jgi:hypothetical protein
VNRQCNLTKRIQTSKGPRYCPVVLSANGRIKPDVVLVEDREERHPEGHTTFPGTRESASSGFQWAKTPPLPLPAAFKRKPNLTP